MNSSILVFLVSICVLASAQYGGGVAQAPPAAYAPPAYGPPVHHYQQPLSDNYVCTIQAHYGLLGQHGKHYRPTTNFCQDSYKQDSCEKCCRMAARIDGTNVKDASIIGFKMVLERQPICVCCSPNTGY